MSLSRPRAGVARRTAEFVLRIAYVTGLWSPSSGRLGTPDEDIPHRYAPRRRRSSWSGAA